MQPDLTTLSDRALYYYRAWTDDRPREKPAFPFQNLPASARLAYELMDWGNYQTYLHLFKNDANEFVDVRFRHKDLLDEYAVDLLENQRFSKKNSGCDWFLRLRATGEYVGALNLYDLSHERTGEGLARPYATIGYLIAEPYRRQGFAYEACLQLLHSLPTLFKRHKVSARVMPENLASIAVLQKLGFRQGKHAWTKNLENNAK